MYGHKGSNPFLTAMKVKFTFTKKDNTEISLLYKPFDNVHANLWVDSISKFIESGDQLLDCNRVYNFTDYSSEIQNTLVSCNQVINELNALHHLDIPFLRKDNLQQDVNAVHTFFVENEIAGNTTFLWSKLNEYLHGIEIIERAKYKNLHGQVFYSLPNSVQYDLPEESYKCFTTMKHFGYCYANYPHIGRHILEMYNAQDEEAHHDHVIPMHKVSGDSYLWFGKTTSWLYDKKRMWDIKKFFYESELDKVLGMSWGDPRLAIGWLPVAKLDQHINKQDLIGLSALKHIAFV